MDVAREWLGRGRRVMVACSGRQRSLGDLDKYVESGQLALREIVSSEQVRFTHHFHEEVGRLARAVIDQWRPDVIHVHNIHGLLAAVRAAIQSAAPVVLTALDFGLVCFNFYLYNRTPKPCAGPASAEVCAACIRRTIHGAGAVFGPVLPRAVTRRFWPRFVRLDQIQSAGELQAGMRRILRLLDAIVAPSPGLADRLARWGAPPSRMVRLPYGVAPDKVVRPVKSPAEPLRLAYLGGAEEVKGLGVLTAAAALLPDGLPLEIRAIGGRAVRMFLEKQPARVRHYVAYCPTLLGRRLAEEHARIDAVLVPSIWHENSPFAVLEALANGTPVLGADEPGISHLILPDHNGWLVEPGRPAAWARALIEAVQRPARIRLMQQNARFTRTTGDFVSDLEELESALIRPAKHPGVEAVPTTAR